MKKIIFRKFLFDYLKFFLIALISSATVIWVFQAVNFLDIMIEDGKDYFVYIKYSLLNYPKTISRIFIFVLFFSLYYVTIKYELNNELILFWNFGINKIKLVNFIFKISIFLTIFHIFLNSFVVPHTQIHAKSLLKTSEINFFDNFIKGKKFNDTIKGLTIYAEEKDNSGELKNLYIKRELDEQQFQITYAKRGEFDIIGNIPLLVLYNGATITSENSSVTNISFSKSDFSLANLKSNTVTYVKTQEMHSSKLIKCIQNIYNLTDRLNSSDNIIENCNIKNIRNVLKEVYKRFIVPFYIPVVSIISLMLIILSKENPKYQKLKITIFLIGFFIILFSETTSRLISNNIFENILLFLIPLLLIFLSYMFLLFKFNKIEKI
ncbi:LptF/LptG family permease [Candidatus Pelagibacter sp. HIMB1542]|uniref:LptF/LptG family permease n=1 Tax=Candidatus Pelagibacter sp. HIMB1542 TaxID=3413346 RepID=UPI003F87EB4B